MKFCRSLWSSLVITGGTLTTCVVSAQARLDETLGKCEERYGKALGRIPGRAQDPEHPIFLFRTEISDGPLKIPVNIRVEFNKEGRAWYIRYSGPFPSAAQQAFLEFNAGDGVWGTSEMFNDRSFYRTNATTPYQATQYRLGTSRVLEVYSYACVQDQKVLRVAQTKAIQADPNWEPFAATAPSSTPATKTSPSGGSSNPALKLNGL